MMAETRSEKPETRDGRSRPRVVVVGAGLAGTVAALEAAANGCEVTVVWKAFGETALCTGAFDVASPRPRLWDENAGPRPDLLRCLGELVHRNPAHPYSVLGEEDPRLVCRQLEGALSGAAGPLFHVRRTAGEGDLPAGWLGNPSLDRMIALCTDGGWVQVTSFAWGSAIDGDLHGMSRAHVGLVDIPSLGGKEPSLIERGLLSYRVLGDSVAVERCTRVTVPLAPKQEVFPLSPARVAAALDRQEEFELFLKQLRSNLPARGLTHLCFPPVLGLQRTRRLLNRLRRELGLPCFEVLSSRSPIQGYRVQRFLLRQLGARSIRCLQGEARIGSPGKAIQIRSGGGLRELQFDQAVLATGKYIGGGVPWTLPAREPAAGLLLSVPNGGWLSVGPGRPGDPEGLALCGVRVDNRLRPLDAFADVQDERVRVAGALCAGFDYGRHRTGLGLALLTGWRAGQEVSSVVTEER